MANMTNAQVQALLPASMTDIQKAIVDALLQHRCIARMGKGPILGTNDEASTNCRICTETLAGELNLQHVVDGHIHRADPNSPASAACQRTTHLNCLVEWSENTIRDNKPVTCPNDRQLLLPLDVSSAINFAFPLFTIPQHRIRDITRVVPFWNCLHPDLDPQPVCHFYIRRPQAAEYPLRMASDGWDVGFVHHSIVNDLPLNNEQRAIFRHCDEAMTRHTPPGQNTPVLVRRYKWYCYIRHMDFLADHETGATGAEFMLMPCTRADYRVLGRYLAGMMGEMMEIRPGRYDDQFIAGRHFLKDADVINLSAETEIRKRMRRRRMDTRQHAAGPWFWPFHNNVGGIVVGGRLPAHDHPARGYDLDVFNVGQANDLRFAALAAESPLPTQIRDRLVDDFEQGRLPIGFPTGWGLDNHQVVSIGADGRPLNHVNPVPPETILAQPLPAPVNPLQPGGLFGGTFPAQQVQPMPAQTAQAPQNPVQQPGGFPNPFAQPFVPNTAVPPAAGVAPPNPFQQTGPPPNPFARPFVPNTPAPPTAGAARQNPFGQPPTQTRPNPFQQTGPQPNPFARPSVSNPSPFPPTGPNTIQPHQPPTQPAFGAPNPHPFGPAWTFQTQQLQAQQQIAQGLQPDPLPTPAQQAQIIQDYTNAQQQDFARRQQLLNQVLNMTPAQQDRIRQLVQDGTIPAHHVANLNNQLFGFAQPGNLGMGAAQPPDGGAGPGNVVLPQTVLPRLNRRANGANHHGFDGANDDDGSDGAWSDDGVQ